MHYDSIAPTPEMCRHLNLEVQVGAAGQVLSARTRNRKIMDDLLDKGYIEHYHAESALNLMVLREIWLGNLSGGISKLSDDIQSVRQNIAPSELYDLVVRITKPHNVRIVLWAANSPAEPLMASVGDICYRSFDVLAGAFAHATKTLSV